MTDQFLVTPHVMSRRQFLLSTSATIAVLPLNACAPIAMALLRVFAFWLSRRVVVWLGKKTAMNAEWRIIAGDSLAVLGDELVRRGIDAAGGSFFELGEGAAVISVDAVDLQISVSANERIQGANLYAWLYSPEWTLWERVRWLWYWSRKARVPVHSKGFFLGQGLTLEPNDSVEIPTRDVVNLSQFAHGSYELDITVVDTTGERGRSKPVQLAVLPTGAAQMLSKYGSYRSENV